MSKTIVFVHGNFVSTRCWENWIPRFEGRGFRCVPIAYPGRDASVETLRANPDPALMASLTIEKVVEHHVRIIRTLPEKPIIIGHSFGGLLTQLLVQRDQAAAAVAIDSVPPMGIIPFTLSFYRSTAPVINPFVPASRPYVMSFAHWQYSFVNGQPLAEQRAAYDRYLVPESRRLARGALSRGGRVDFKRQHAPLLLIGGENDRIMPAAVNRQNFARYAKSSPSITEYKEFTGRNHFTVIGGRGWEEVADYSLDWAVRMAERPARDLAEEDRQRGNSTAPVFTARDRVGSAR